MNGVSDVVERSVGMPSEEYSSVQDIGWFVLDNLHIIIPCCLLAIIIGVIISSLIDRKRFDVGDIGGRFLKLFSYAVAFFVAVIFMVVGCVIIESILRWY